MHQLKKWAAGGGLVALAACWPLAVGQIAQNVLTDGVENLSGDQFKAEIVEYKRNYLSASAVTRVQVTDPEIKAQLEADGVATEYLFEHQIEHGLFSVKGLTRLDDEQVKLLVTTTTSLNGDTRFELGGMPVSLTDASGGSVTFSDYSASGNVALSGSSALDFSLPSVTIEFANGDNFVMKNFTLSGEGEQAGSFWLGEQKLAMEQIALKAAGGDEVFAMNDLSYRITAQKSDDQLKISASQVFNTGNSVIGGQQFDRLAVALSLNDVNFDALSGVMEAYRKGSELSKEEADKAVPLLETLIKDGLKFSLDDVSMDSPEGSLKGEIRLELTPGTEAFASNPTAAVNNIQGHLSMSTQQSLLDANPALRQQVDELIIQELVKVEGDDYVLAGEVNNGIITFETGKQLPVWVLLMPLLLGGR